MEIVKFEDTNASQTLPIETSLKNRPRKLKNFKNREKWDIYDFKLFRHEIAFTNVELWELIIRECEDYLRECGGISRM